MRNEGECGVPDPWGVDGVCEPTGVLAAGRGQKRGSMLRYVSEVIQVMQKCHCDVRKIVSCQPRAFGWISSESMGNEV